MGIITEKDREHLRALAIRHREYAYSPKNEEILKKWEALAEGRRFSPTVRLLFSNFTDEVITPRMECESQTAREIEAHMLWMLVGRDLFDDDTPIEPVFRVAWRTYVEPFSLQPHITRLPGGKGYEIHPLIEGFEPEEIEKLGHGTFGVDRVGTLKFAELVDSILGDILPVRIFSSCLPGAITNPLVHRMGMENYFMSMYDYPDELHQVMDAATRVYEDYYDFLEKEQLLTPYQGCIPINQESFSFNRELPTEGVTSTSQCWGFLESQETTSVSPEMFGEFVFPYQDRLARRFGLLSYGCCERVDAIFPDYLSKWPNLRKLSVSPFNHEEQVGEYLRGTTICYYSKPRAEYVTNSGPLDEEALRRYFKGVCHAASGCLFEMAQREVGTIYGDFERGRRYVEIARECIENDWQP